MLYRRVVNISTKGSDTIEPYPAEKSNDRRGYQAPLHHACHHVIVE